LFPLNFHDSTAFFFKNMLGMYFIKKNQSLIQTPNEWNWLERTKGAATSQKKRKNREAHRINGIASIATQYSLNINNSRSNG